jgi:hypothetical protein
MKATARAFLAALGNQNWDEIEACFTPDVTFRGLIPPGVREGADASAAAGYFRRWFGDADELILAASDVQEVEDRLSIRYRFRAHEDRWYVIEQHAFCDVRGDRIERIDLLCSGFRPEG